MADLAAEYCSRLPGTASPPRSAGRTRGSCRNGAMRTAGNWRRSRSRSPAPHRAMSRHLPMSAQIKVALPFCRRLAGSLAFAEDVRIGVLGFFHWRAIVVHAGQETLAPEKSFGVHVAQVRASGSMLVVRVGTHTVQTSDAGLVHPTSRSLSPPCPRPAAAAIPRPPSKLASLRAVIITIPSRASIPANIRSIGKAVYPRATPPPCAVPMKPHVCRSTPFRLEYRSQQQLRQAKARGSRYSERSGAGTRHRALPIGSQSDGGSGREFRASSRPLLPECNRRPPRPRCFYAIVSRCCLRNAVNMAGRR